MVSSPICSSSSSPRPRFLRLRSGGLAAALGGCAMALGGCASTSPSASPSELMADCPVPRSRSAVSGETLTRSGATTLTDALQGRVAGVRVGYDRGRRVVQIRGTSSFQRAEPLVVVDEVWQAQRGSVALDRINTFDVAFLEVLKDSDASARFGSEGGSGVIAITTRRAGCDASGTRDPRPPSERNPSARPAPRGKLPVLPPARRPVGVAT